jgi:hypothetical protein
MKYIMTYNTKFGSVSVESKDPEDLITAYTMVQDLAGRVSKKNGTSKDSIRASLKKRESAGSGVRETAVILRELESSVLPSKFFSQPKTTGETREKLHEVTGKYFTSRKVSQALGILREKSQLKRTGKRNFYSYSLT